MTAGTARARCREGSRAPRLRLVRRQRFAEYLGQRLAPPHRRKVIELRRPRRVRRVQQLRHRRQLERLAQMLGRPRDVRNRQREVEPHVAVHVREPAGLANERVAVQQDERRLAEALDQRLEVRRVGAPAGAGPRRRSRSAPARAADRRSPRSPSAPRRRRPRRDRGRRGTPRSSSARRSPPRERRLTSRRLVRLDSQHRQRAAAGELAEPLPLDARARRREAVVDEQPLGVRRAQERRRVLVGIAAPPVLVAPRPPSPRRRRAPRARASRAGT